MGARVRGGHARDHDQHGAREMDTDYRGRLRAQPAPSPVGSHRRRRQSHAGAYGTKGHHPRYPGMPGLAAAIDSTPQGVRYSTPWRGATRGRSGTDRRAVAHYCAAPRGRAWGGCNPRGGWRPGRCSRARRGSVHPPARHSRSASSAVAVLDAHTLPHGIAPRSASHRAGAMSEGVARGVESAGRRQLVDGDRRATPVTVDQCQTEPEGAIGADAKA